MEGDDIFDIDWGKFAICYALLVILPVWIFVLVDISFLWKIGFSIAGAIGCWWALKYGALRGVSK